MRGKRWMVLLVALMLAVFAGTGQAAVIYASGYSGVDGVDTPANLIGAPTQNASGVGGSYAGFSFGDSMTVTFDEKFSDTPGSDVFVYVASNDTDRSALFMNAHLVSPVLGISDIPVVFDPNSGVYRLGEIGLIVDWSGYEFDSLFVKYIGLSTFEIDAIGVNSATSAPVPEPGTMMLLGSGLVGLAGWGRKKFRK